MNIHNDIDKFVALRPSVFRFLKAVSFLRNVSRQGCSAYSVEMTLSNVSGYEVESIRLQFENVVNIKINDIESMQGILLDIRDISQDQLEGVSFRVSEQENCAFSFDCSDFYVGFSGDNLRINDGD